MKVFTNQHRQQLGDESICRIYQIASSAYWRHAACQRRPALRSLRAQRDAKLLPQVQGVRQATMQIYRAKMVWRQPNRESVAVVRCTVDRLVRQPGLLGVRRGKGLRRTIAHPKPPCPLDRVNRQFRAVRRNQLWVSDSTFVSTWQGWVYMAFGEEVFSRRIAGWCQSNSMHTEFVLGAQGRALFDRQPSDGLVHHSDRGSPSLSIRYSERLAEAGIVSSVGSEGDSYDNAPAAAINRLHKTDAIHRRRPWKTMLAVELVSLEWCAWFNHHRLTGPLGHVPHAGFEANIIVNALVGPRASDLNQLASAEPWAIHVAIEVL